MGDIVNLRRVKKARARQEAETEAAQNRVRFGTPAQLRKNIKAETARARRAIDAHKVDWANKSKLEE